MITKILKGLWKYVLFALYVLWTVVQCVFIIALLLLAYVCLVGPLRIAIDAVLEADAFWSIPIGLGALALFYIIGNRLSTKDEKDAFVSEYRYKSLVKDYVRLKMKYQKLLEERAKENEKELGKEGGNGDAA